MMVLAPSRDYKQPTIELFARNCSYIMYVIHHVTSILDVGVKEATSHCTVRHMLSFVVLVTAVQRALWGGGGNILALLGKCLACIARSLYVS